MEPAVVDSLRLPNIAVMIDVWLSKCRTLMAVVLSRPAAIVFYRLVTTCDWRRVAILLGSRATALKLAPLSMRVLSNGK